MPPLSLEGDTLGQKHQHFNKLVKDAVTDEHYELTNINNDDSDIQNLLKINVASKKKNVHYILEVMKSNDMLYASTAIRQCTWIITDQKYAHIINPEYLHTQLLPNMNTRAFNKLMLHIRLKLRDEQRVEAFYEYLKNEDNAHRWLQNCSIPFIENVIKNDDIPLCLFKRLCRRSPHLLTYYKKVKDSSMYTLKREILFLLKSHTEEVLKVLKDDNSYYFPNLNKKQTELIMKKCPQIILNDFESFVNTMELSVAAKYFKKDEIKDFLYNEMKKSCWYLCEHRRLRYFIRNMPEEQKFAFVKKTFIDKTELGSYCSKEQYEIIKNTKTYEWYEHAPFSVAFSELKQLIRAESSASERCAILSVLITCTRQNPQHIKSLLTFYNEKHMNEAFKFKIQFVYDLLSRVSTHEFDVETWNILDKLFYSLEVYTESDNNIQLCLQSIILYKILHDETVPDIVEKKVRFNPFRGVQNKLDAEQRDKVFTYLINSAMNRVQSKIIENESDFIESIQLLKEALTLLEVWEKDITNYPFILENIQNLVKIKEKNMWQTELTDLYKNNKLWRKYMFENSLTMCLSEETCLNVLKHKPQLLMHHDKQIETLRTNDAVSLPRLLAKLRVYWPHTLAQYWTNAYLLNIRKTTGQKALVKGLFMLLPQNQIIDMAKKHMPDNYKITWGETDQTEISIRKNIAQNLHVARPQIPLDTILWYAKGDYLQYAVPSLNSVLSTLSRVESREHLPKLLGAPVSLQKFGLTLACSKLKPDEQKVIFWDIWNTTKNLTIRTVLFKHTYAKICNVKDVPIEKELWDLLNLFIDNLSNNENAEIYKKLGKVDKIPISIRAQFYMKSYEFLISLPSSSNCDKYVEDLVRYAPTIIEELDEEFIINKLLSPPETKFCSHRSNFVKVFACFVLHGKTEEGQLRRFRRVMEPAINQAFLTWYNAEKNDYYVQENFDNFIKCLVWTFKTQVSLNKICIPTKLFLEIKNKMVENLPLLENYILYTSWKLIAEYINLMEEHRTCSVFKSTKFTDSDYGNYESMTDELDRLWKQIHVEIAPSLATIIMKCLKEDTERHSLLICPLFAEALNKMFQNVYNQDSEVRLEVIKLMLNDAGSIPNYIVGTTMIPKYCDSEMKSLRSELRSKIKAHPSDIVRMHYYKEFRTITEDN